MKPLSISTRPGIAAGMVALALGAAALSLTPASASATASAAPRCHNAPSTLAIGSPGATEGDDEDAGAVTIATGTPHGLAGRSLWSEATAGVPGGPSVGGDLGANVAVGDFNGDGCPDVAIMQDESGDNNSQVIVLFGAPNGDLSTVGAQAFGSNQVCGDCGDPDYFSELGAVMATGDFNGDGYDDLALNVVSNDGNGDTSVVVVSGGPSGLQPTTDDPVFGGLLRGFTSITSLSAGDVNGDGIDDLVAGFGARYVDPDDLIRSQAEHATPAKTPRTDHGGQNDIAVLYGAHGGINTGKKRQDLNRDSAGVPGHESYAGPRHQVVAVTTALGDFNHDGHADLAFWEQRSSTVTVVPGATSGLKTSHAKNWSKATHGVPGRATASDPWGASLAVGDFNGDHADDLVVGDPSTQHITVLPGSKKHGLTAAGSEDLSPATPKVPGALTKGQDWSSRLAVGNFGWGSPDDLVVADPESDGTRGSITVFYGSHKHQAGLGVKHVKRLTRASPAMPGPAETLDYFGAGLSGR